MTEKELLNLLNERPLLETNPTKRLQFILDKSGLLSIMETITIPTYVDTMFELPTFYVQNKYIDVVERWLTREVIDKSDYDDEENLRRQTITYPILVATEIMNNEYVNDEYKENIKSWLMHTYFSNLFVHQPTLQYQLTFDNHKFKLELYNASEEIKLTLQVPPYMSNIIEIEVK